MNFHTVAWAVSCVAAAALVLHLAAHAATRTETLPSTHRDRSRRGERGDDEARRQRPELGPNPNSGRGGSVGRRRGLAYSGFVRGGGTGGHAAYPRMAIERRLLSSCSDQGTRRVFICPCPYPALRDIGVAGASAEVLNASELGVELFDSRTQERNWGSTISVKSSEKSSSSTPWVDVTVPSAARLAGKTAKLKLELSLIYPEMDGSSAYREATASAVVTPAAALATPGAGNQYRWLWWIGRDCVPWACAWAGGCSLPRRGSSRPDGRRTCSPSKPKRNEKPGFPAVTPNC